MKDIKLVEDLTREIQLRRDRGESSRARIEDQVWRCFDTLESGYKATRHTSLRDKKYTYTTEVHFKSSTLFAFS